LEQREARQGDSKRRVLKEKSFCCDNYSPFAATILSHFVLPPTPRILANFEEGGERFRRHPGAITAIA
jgi:hypothetical protein